MAMSETDSVTSFTNKHRDNFSNFRRQAERTGVSELEALKIGIFERGLTPELYERQRLGPYCRTMQESSDRAQRSASTLEQSVDSTVSTLWSTVARKKPQSSRGRSTTTQSTVHMDLKRSRSNQRGKSRPPMLTHSGHSPRLLHSSLTNSSRVPSLNARRKTSPVIRRTAALIALNTAQQTSVVSTST